MLSVRFSTFPLVLNLVIFTAAGLMVWFAGVRLSTYADALSVRTRLSQAFLGIALLGVATSLAEVATTVTAASIGNADLVSGNLFGGVALQITVLAIVDLLVVRGALTYFTPSAVLLFQGAMLILMLSLALAGGAIGEPVVIFGVGLTAMLLAGAYLVTLRISKDETYLPRWRPADESAPPLSDPVLVQKGASAYENNCRVCHGSPKLPHPPVAQHMLPRPPYLPQVVSEWDREELFYIVKHGLKFTGMPAWPSQQRDDEVWAVVAFLLEFPKLDQNSYRSLVGTDAAAEFGEAFEQVLRHCESCHGPQGMGRAVGAAPRLAGQKVDYLYSSLSAYARQQRFSGIMQPVAARLNEEQMQRLAQHYANLSQNPQSETQVLPAAIERGERIANNGIREQRVPACNSCHGRSGPTNPVYPELSGQYANYIVLQLKLFQGEQRGGTPFAHLMRHVAPNLSGDQMQDVARYYESLAPQAASVAK